MYRFSSSFLVYSRQCNTLLRFFLKYFILFLFIYELFHLFTFNYVTTLDLIIDVVSFCKSTMKLAPLYAQKYIIKSIHDRINFKKWVHWYRQRAQTSLLVAYFVSSLFLITQIENWRQNLAKKTVLVSSVISGMVCWRQRSGCSDAPSAVGAATIATYINIGSTHLVDAKF